MLEHSEILLHGCQEVSSFMECINIGNNSVVTDFKLGRTFLPTFLTLFLALTHQENYLLE